MHARPHSAVRRSATASLIEVLESRIAPAAVAAINLSSLDGKTGFKLSGVADGDLSGGSVSDAGDINGDGFGDLIVGAYRAGEGGSYRGASYVVFGKAGGFGASVALSALDGTNGFKLSGAADGDYSGRSVSAAGDVNGDGFADLIIGAFRADEGGTNANRGASYVVFGKAGGFGASVGLSALNGTNGFKLSGVADGDESGRSVSAAGDVNGDGFDDLIIGAYYAAETGTARGASYVVFGKADFSATAGSLNLSALNGTNGFKLSGVADKDYSGNSVSAAGDVNGDGFGDLIIGAYRANEGGVNADRGASYVVFGKADFSATAGTLNLSTLDGTNGFKLSGVADKDYSGVSVSAAGDVNGDGFGDLIIGAFLADEGAVNANRGASYVVFGKANFSGTAGSFNLSTLDGTNGFKLSGVANGDNSGKSVSAAGDVNGDGFADLIVGAPYADEGAFNADRGASYVVFGKAHGFGGSMALSALDGTNGFKLSGVADADRAGHSVSTAGDVNGDGFADLIIGAFGADGGTDRGAAYVVFGSSPIALSKDHKTATFPDADGDIASVKVSKGALSRHDFTFNSDGSLGTLDLRDPLFAGADVTLSAKKAKNGDENDGVVNVDKIDAHGIDLGKVSVSGNLRQIFAGDSFVKTAGVKSLTVGGTLGHGNAGPTAAEFHSEIVGALGALTVKGGAFFMDFEVTGGQFAGIGKIAITDSLVGIGNVVKSGFIHASGDIGAVKIGGSVQGGADFSGIAAGGKLGKVSIGGALTSNDATKPVILSALGRLGATTTKDAVAIAGVSVKTDVLNARILAGYNVNLAPLNPDAGIGAIKVDGKWEASSIAAGVQDTSTAGDLTSAPDGFGRNDTVIAGDTMPNLFSKIASIVIKGTAIGRALPTTEFFGITAQEVDKISINGITSLPAGNAPIDLDSTNHNFLLVRF